MSFIYALFYYFFASSFGFDYFYSVEAVYYEDVVDSVNAYSYLGSSTG